MKARYLLSMLAAIACPAVVSAQAPAPGPDAPPPPDRREARPPGDHGPGPSNDLRQDGPRRDQGGHHHRHPARQQTGEPGPDGQPGDLREKIGHIREALHHLRAAGMNEEAEHLEKEIRSHREEFAQKHHDGNREHNGPPMQGRPTPGNFAAPQDGNDVRAQIERVMHDVQELRMELRRMRAGNSEHHADGAGPPGDGPRGMRPPFSPSQMNNNADRDGEHHRGEHRDGAGPNPQSRGDRPPGPGHQDGGNKGPDPRAAGPQGQSPPFPRPEWRDHGGANPGGPGNAEHHRGEHRDGPQPPAPPQGDRPPGGPANEGTLEDIVPLPPAPAQE